MPELPDVEVLKQYVESTALHKEIESVEVEEETVLKEITPQQLGRKLVGKRFLETRRHGKFLFARLDETTDWLVLHFGMTGDLKYYKLPAEKPEYEAVAIHFRNGYTLGYVMIRKLGEVRLVSNVADFIDRRDFGPDVFSDAFSFAKFKELLEGRRGMIKSALMNQSIMAGIGNVYSDEILFQAGIHPKAKVNNLDDEHLRQIYEQIEHVLKMAIKHQAEPGDFPEGYIVPLRGDEDAECPGCSGTLERIEVSGRGGYYCPNCQTKPEGGVSSR
jgi:formamidopyrimidine-DNA glycosylase